MNLASLAIGIVGLFFARLTLRRSISAVLAIALALIGLRQAWLVWGRVERNHEVLRASAVLPEALEGDGKTLDGLEDAMRGFERSVVRDALAGSRNPVFGCGA